MEHRRSKVALFFVVQALAVGTMIFLVRAGRAPHCNASGCERATPQLVVVPVFVIVGELVLLARVLRADGPVWKTLAGLGILSLIVALFASGMGARGRVAPVAPIVAGWHLVAGFLLLGAGAAAGVGELGARLRRSGTLKNVFAGDSCSTLATCPRKGAVGTRHRARRRHRRRVRRGRRWAQGRSRSTI